MKKRETQKFNSIETSKVFCENNGLCNRSQRIAKRKKFMNQQKYLTFLIIEIELHGNANESKGIHLKKFC